MPATDAARLLLIEDDLALADGLARALRQAGYAVDGAGTAAAACAALERRHYDLLILDLGLPDLDGSAVVEHLADRKLDTPVLVLSARDGLDERIRLLDRGADDYLVKPTAVAELLARVRVLLRRMSRGAALMNVGRMQLDVEGQRAFVDGKPLDLNAREWTLLLLLASRANRVVRKEDIAQALLGGEKDVSDNAIEVIVSRFRPKLAAAGLRLRALRGLGYFLETVDEPGA